jgi:hypothetical protein
MAQPISPKATVEVVMQAPKKVIGNTFTVQGLAACINSAPFGVVFEGCSLLCGRTVVPIDKEGRVSPATTK